jgi:hypothetical protein
VKVKAPCPAILKCVSLSFVSFLLGLTLPLASSRAVQARTEAKTRSPLIVTRSEIKPKLKAKEKDRNKLSALRLPDQSKQDYYPAAVYRIPLTQGQMINNKVAALFFVTCYDRYFRTFRRGEVGYTSCLENSNTLRQPSITQPSGAKMVMFGGSL